MRRNTPPNRSVHPNRGTENQLILLESYGWTVVSSGSRWSLTCQVGKSTCLGIQRGDSASDLLALLPTHKTQHPKSFP